MTVVESKNKVIKNPLLYITRDAKSSDLFKFIDPLENDKLSTLSPGELLQFLTLLDSYYLEYRSILGLSKDIPFSFTNSVEETCADNVILAIDACSDDIQSRVNNSETSGKFIVFDSGCLCDDVKTWEAVNKLLESVKAVSSIDKKSSNRVYVGYETMGDDTAAWQRFITLWSAYENILYRFFNGEYLNSRPFILNQAKPVASRILDPNSERYLFKEEDCKKFFSNLGFILRRYYDLYSAFDTDHLEITNNPNLEVPYNNLFGCLVPNGTLNPVVLQNNINVFAKMLIASKLDTIDMDAVNNRLKFNTDNRDISVNDGIYGNPLVTYDLIYIDQALEFCDLVFDNNFDKVYFLRQYFKSYELPKKKRGLQRAKNFTADIK